MRPGGSRSEHRILEVRVLHWLEIFHCTGARKSSVNGLCEEGGRGEEQIPALSAAHFPRQVRWRRTVLVGPTPPPAPPAPCAATHGVLPCLIHPCVCVGYTALSSSRHGFREVVGGCPDGRCRLPRSLRGTGWAVDWHDLLAGRQELPRPPGPRQWTGTLQSAALRTMGFRQLPMCVGSRWRASAAATPSTCQ